MLKHLIAFFFFLANFSILSASVKVGADRLFEEEYVKLIKGKKIGLITNHTAVGSDFKSTSQALKANALIKGYRLIALFAPEHGIDGRLAAEQLVIDGKDTDDLPIYSLHGKTRRPNDQMLKGIDLLIFDIQDIGSRSYTYVNTMFYAMEEAAKRKISFLVLDRPNPINGIIVDGPIIEEKWRSFLGYINTPYCHGMTVGELARYFNEEYKVGCKLDVVPMQGWKRWMSFQETGLQWIPTSPNIPEPSTPFYYPTTGIIGDLKLVNIGIGYTLPFKVIGAPWIKAVSFAESLNAQKFPGVHFEPFYYQPLYGRFAKEDCEGVLIQVLNPLVYKPVSTQYLILGILKGLYPEKFQEIAVSLKSSKDLFCKLNGTEEAYRLLAEEKNIVWKLCGLHRQEREDFLKRRQKYLIKDY